MVWIVLGAAFVLVWLASRERPLYTKAYFQTRSDGVFRTDYAPGFKEYLEGVDKEVAARFAVGPFSPTDDLHVDLYHPELEQNWRRELRRNTVYDWLRDGMNVLFAVAMCAALAGRMTYVLVRSHSPFSEPGDPNITAKMIAWFFAVTAYVYVQRRRNAISRTQGYLDGYSDRSAGPEHAMRVIAPPSPRG